MWNPAARVVQRLAAVQRVNHHPVFKARCVGFVPVMEILKCLHVKARGEVYPCSEIRRFLVPDDKVDWEVPWTNYNPVDYTAPALLKQPPWADPPYRDEGELNKLLKFNQLDGDVDRRSYTGKYQVINGFPRNPCGRTGLKGRGLLGRWGPNHAADPIVTRWKKEGGKRVTHNCSGKPVLQFVAICRRDNKEWAIPGLKQLERKSLLLLANDLYGSGSLENGMVDPGEKVSATLRREFGEETLDSLSLPEAERQKVKELISSLFQAGEMVYKGYVDDPRNTDNAWMETVAMNFHDETGDSVGKLNLQAGDDAGAVKWMDIEEQQKLYASHTHFLHQVAKAKNAHW